MRRPLVAGNWKMHGTHSSVAELIKGLRQLALPSGVDVAVMPPCLFISQVIQGLAGKAIDVGAQNSAVEPMQGALTGETAPSQLADVGCSMVLVGHSERRLILGESDEVVSRKFAAAQSCGLVPVLCVGETRAEREAGKTLEVVARQLGSVIDELGVGAFARAVVAARSVVPREAEDAGKGRNCRASADGIGSCWPDPRSAWQGCGCRGFFRCRCFGNCFRKPRFRYLFESDYWYTGSGFFLDQPWLSVLR